MGIREESTTARFFLLCPMPRRGADQQDRNAAVIMTYFRPFTLVSDVGDQHVPFLGLCKGRTSWHDAFTTWMDGQLLCEESRRYISSLLVVTRARTDHDAQDEQRSEDLASDEEFCGDKRSLETALETRIGAMRRRGHICCDDGERTNDANE